MHERHHAGVAAAIWIVGLALLSFLPTHEKQDLHTHGQLHAVGHLLVFLVAAMLAAASVHSVGMRAVVLVLVAVLGVSIEWAQHVTSGVPLEWHDITVDLLGVALGALLLAAAGGMRGTGDRLSGSDL